MIARDLISDKIPSVKSTDSLGNALAWMNEFKITQLPVVDKGIFSTMITEEDVLDAADLRASVGETIHTGWEGAYVVASHHVYDALATMVNFNLEMVPVLGEDKIYLGAITLRDLLRYLGTLFAMNEKGSVIVVKIPQNGYMLSEIGRIVESADAKVLSLHLSQSTARLPSIATLKLNVEDPTRVVASFERFEYKVVETYYRSEQMENLQRNLDALMNYLDI